MIFESLSSEKPKNTICVKNEKKKISFRAGYLPQGIPLQLIGYLPEEPSFLPWHAASRALYQLDKLLDRTEEYSLFSVICHLVNLLSNLKNVNLKKKTQSFFFFSFTGLCVEAGCSSVPSDGLANKRRQQ